MRDGERRAAEHGAQGWSAWPAPAKLNLFLHIVGRRADGYHLLQTVFQLLDWGDTVRLRLREDGAIRRIDPLPGIAAADDLAVRAARALQAASGVGLGADIAIDKRIPFGGGLGGGSFGCGDRAGGPEPTVAVAASTRTNWPRSGLPSAPTCRCSCAAAAPGPKASASS